MSPFFYFRHSGLCSAKLNAVDLVCRNKVLSSTVNIKAQSIVEARLYRLPKNVTFVIIHAFCFTENATLSYSDRFKKFESSTGRESGLVYYRQNADFKYRFGAAPALYKKTALSDVVFDEFQSVESVKNEMMGQVFGDVLSENNVDGRVFLRNAQSSNIQCQLVVVSYDAKAPVPGGCNMEFDVETSPFVRLRYQFPAMVLVEFQDGRLPPTSGSEDFFTASCDMSYRLLRYEVYVAYFDDDDQLNVSLTLLTDVDMIDSVATRLDVLQANPKNRLVFMAYPRQIGAYVVVVTYRWRAGDREGLQRATYVPAITRGCLDFPAFDDCAQAGVVAMVLYGILVCFSVLVALNGYYWSFLSAFAGCFFLIAVFVDVLLTSVTSWDGHFVNDLSIGLGVIVGIVGAVGEWYMDGRLFAGMTCASSFGFLIFSLIVNTPIGNAFALRAADTYRVVTLLACTSVVTLLLAFSYMMLIVSSSAVGCYGVIYAIVRLFNVAAHFGHEINVAVYRLAQQNIIRLNNVMPSYTNDWCLLLAWLLSSSVCVGFQTWYYSLRKHQDLTKRGVPCTCNRRHPTTETTCAPSAPEEHTPQLSGGFRIVRSAGRSQQLRGGPVVRPEEPQRILLDNDELCQTPLRRSQRIAAAQVERTPKGTTTVITLNTPTPARARRCTNAANESTPLGARRRSYNTFGVF